MPSLEYLDEERVKLWAELRRLEDEIGKKASDFENEAKQASKKASEFRNRAEEAKLAAIGHLDEIKQKLQDINSAHETSRTLDGQISGYSTEAQAKHAELESIVAKVEEQNATLQEKIVALEDAFEQQPAFIEKMKVLEEIQSKSDDFAAKIDAVYAALTNRRKEIDKLYYEIIGVTEKNEKTGETTQVAGLKGELERAYADVREKVAQLNEEYQSIKVAITTDFESFVQKHNGTVACIGPN